KPLNIIVEGNNIQDIKKELIHNNILFNDGYEHIEFSDEIFFNKPIINKKTNRNGTATDNLDKISFKLRLLSQSKYTQIETHKFSPQMIYYFDSEINETFNNIPFLKIDKLNTKQLNDLLIF